MNKKNRGREEFVNNLCQRGKLSHKPPLRGKPFITTGTDTGGRTSGSMIEILLQGKMLIFLPPLTFPAHTPPLPPPPSKRTALCMFGLQVEWRSGFPSRIFQYLTPDELARGCVLCSMVVRPTAALHPVYCIVYSLAPSGCTTKY
jgi:hypothetical protein